jgi:F-type H+-transporting ATPase subunit a
MNFEHILEHHLMDHRFRHFLVGGIDLGLSNHLVMLWIVSAIITAVLSFAAASNSGAGRVLRGGVESIVFFLRDDVLEPIFGHHTRAYLPYFLTLFFFILTCNLIGLIPGAHAITANITVTAALAACTFLMIQLAGVLEQGPVSYVVHIVPGGVPLALWPVLFVIELFGMFAKCISLSIRLFANIIAGHIVSLAFLSLIFIFAEAGKVVGLAVAPAAVGLALFVYTMDVLVAFLQAYIFTMLTALFVGGAVHPH